MTPDHIAAIFAVLGIVGLGVFVWIGIKAMARLSSPLDGD